MTSKKRPLPTWMSHCKENNPHAARSDTETKKSKEQRHIEASQKFDKELHDLQDEIIFTGKIVYSYHISDCSILCEDIEMSFCDMTGVYMGFDMEWPVTYQAGKQDKTAVLQLCTAPDICYIFHLSSIGCLPSSLCHLLQNNNVLKVGVGIESDLWKLERDYGITVYSIIKNSMVDLSDLANKALRTSEKWSLEGLVRHLFGKKISKDPSVRKSNWSNHPLSESQQSYAATDAYVSYIIYQKLSQIMSNSKDVSFR